MRFSGAGCSRAERRDTGNDDAPFAVWSEGGFFMPEALRVRLRSIARRAGLRNVPDSVVLAAVVACVLLVAIGAWRWWPREGAEAADAGVQVQRAAADSGAHPTAGAAEGGARAEDPAGASSAATSAATVWVHVVGAVRHPGVYELPAGSRIVTALDAAGGLLGNAAPQAVNLARPVTDGEQIAVPTKDEFAANPNASAPGGPQAAAAAGAGRAAGAAGGPGAPVDLNSADAALLDTLPGIGPSTAAKIVADREANGPYLSVDDLGRVPGIGPKKLDSLKDLVCVR